MEEFRLVLVDCGLVDIGFIGSKFTWCNKRKRSEFTKCRLDMALVNDEWLNLFEVNQVFDLPGQYSDHNPLLIHCLNSVQVEAPKQKGFTQGFKLVITQEGLKVCRDKLKRKVDGYLEEEELKWRQRAKQRWLKDGDRITKFFHKCASQRKQVNTIKQIISEDGSLALSQEEIAKTFQSFYQNLFSSSNPS
ncbi:hypothetical protein F2P56_011269, partial [Juglans regia]